MASKLFHTVVSFGISLGAMSAGCSAAPAEETSQAGAAQTERAVAEPPVADRFCEVAWPTTKGGPRPEPAMACIDPARECGPYPGQLFAYPQCVPVDGAGQCVGDGSRFWMFCKGDGDEHRWACPSGTVEGSTCPEPEAAR